MVLGATASALYLYEAYKELAIESFTALLLFKNFFSFALTYKSFDWLDERGTWLLHRDIALVQMGVCLLSVPMCRFPSCRMMMWSADWCRCLWQTFACLVGEGRAAEEDGVGATARAAEVKTAWKEESAIISATVSGIRDIKGF